MSEIMMLHLYRLLTAPDAGEAVERMHDGIVLALIRARVERLGYRVVSIERR